MLEHEALCLQEHAGAGAELGSERIAALDPCVTVVADDWVAAVQEVAANLVKTSCLRTCFDQGNAVVQAVAIDDPKRCFGAALDSVGVFAQWFIARPVIHLGLTIDDGPVDFFDLVVFECPMHLPGGVLLNCEQQYSASGAIDPMNHIHLLTDLIAQDFHRHQITLARLFRGMHQMTCWFVDRDYPLILVENGEWRNVDGQIELERNAKVHSFQH
ncbi:MAG: hypothetical protein ACI9R3_006050 [Verrucomicrobiales bacterium]|jgi:hypothetical protein